jgi:S-adenosylmethionine synthetase
MVDSYGSMAPHGGGCFSGKDPTKVDRSAAYMARYVAKNIVASGAADRVQLQVAYAIGTAHPVSLSVDTFGTHHVDPDRVRDVVKEMFDFRPAAIIHTLDLRRPIYKETAAYGHFGRKGFSWEETDRADELRRAIA